MFLSLGAFTQTEIPIEVETVATFTLPNLIVDCDLTEVLLNQQRILDNQARVEVKIDSMLFMLNSLFIFSFDDQVWDMNFELMYAPGQPVPTFIPDSVNARMIRRP